MKELALINLENVSESEASGYRIRETARAAIFDEDRRIAIIHVTKYKFFKLPGGGIEKGESVIEALRRECKEEVGCDIEILEEVGKVTEHRKRSALKQTSYCYTAKQVGKRETPHLTEDEIEEGVVVTWMSVEEAMQKIEQSMSTDDYKGSYIVRREHAFLNAILEGMQGIA